MCVCYLLASSKLPAVIFVSMAYVRTSELELRSLLLVQQESGSHNVHKYNFELLTSLNHEIK